MPEKRNISFSSYLSKKKTIFVFCILLFLIPSVGILLVKPLEYSSTVSVLIIQKINPNLDAYTAARAAEKLGKNLASIIYTTSFFEKVKSSSFNLNIDWPSTEKEKRKLWQTKITARAIPDTSILEITAYDQDPQKAEKLAQAVAYILVSEGKEYHGGGEDIVIKSVDSSLTSDLPVRPNILLNVVSGLFFGIFVAIFIIFWKYTKENF